jgi:hypothetical protein
VQAALKPGLEDFPDDGFVTKIKLAGMLPGRPRWARWDKKSGYPPSPPFSKFFGIINLARNCRQDLDVKELRYQTLENKRLMGATMRVHPTVTASTMITRFDFGRKVRYHKALWKSEG